MLFYRFISENLSAYVNEKQKEAGELNFNYAALSDEDSEHGRELILEEKGFFIHPSELFEAPRLSRNTYHILLPCVFDLFLG
jgi:type I restriction enzyme M protein